MIIVKLQGGMGNQMFQYALGRYLSLKYGVPLKLDTHFLLDRTPRKEFFVFRDYDLDIFNLTVDFASIDEIKCFTNWVSSEMLNRVVRKLIGRKPDHIYEPHHQFYPAAFEAGPNSYLEGYWQSEKYFAPVAETIRKDFTVKQPLGAAAEQLAADMSKYNAICVNVRRGDFVVTSTHGTCGVDYYAAAEKIMLEKLDEPRFYVFSDEIEWCRDNLRFSAPTTFVDHAFAGPKFQDYLRLMSLCKHFIIPNSSFAWWAAYLSSNQEKTVIAPKAWFAEASINTCDQVPPEWTRI